MKTTRLALFYQITQKEIYPPAARELERKENWLKSMQKTVEADHKPLIVKVTYELFDPEMERQRRFFEGACVPYWVIQQKDMLTGEPDTETLKQAREEILDEMLGYDFHAVTRVIRRRKSTADFKSVQKWSSFLKTLEETIFDSAGYEMPDSDNFWEMVKQHGHDEAKRIAIEQLQARLKKRV